MHEPKDSNQKMQKDIHPKEELPAPFIDHPHVEALAPAPCLGCLRNMGDGSRGGRALQALQAAAFRLVTLQMPWLGAACKGLVVGEVWVSGDGGRGPCVFTIGKVEPGGSEGHLW